MHTVKNVPVLVPFFLYTVTTCMLNFQIKRILFQVKNGLTTSLILFFFGKCLKFGSVGRR